ncbi:hypothetical protein [Muricoccus aerilatus]|uniref:hypothetical protein n=1 Tax=Muricoccus aerilatus TaxID=452982 RepID=UPI000A3E1862
MSVHLRGRMVGVTGVIDLELLSVIRRWHHQDRVPIREIERRTSLSRNTIRKYLRSDTVGVEKNVQDVRRQIWQVIAALRRPARSQRLAGDPLH